MSGAVPLAAVSVEAVVFHVLAAVVVLSAFVAAVAPRIVHAAFGLVAAFLGVAGLYGLLGADFLAFAQVIVYVGGILVLLVFGVLLTARGEADLGGETPTRRGFAAAVGGLLFVALLLTLGGTRWPVADTPGAPEPTTAPLGRALLDPDGMLVPFEIASVLLLAALVGAAYLVRRRRSS